MFVLKFQGSVLKVEQDSEISIGLDGVKVTPLAVQPKRIKDPMLDAISSAVGEAAEAHLKDGRRGAKPNPESTMQKVLAYCNKLNALGQDFNSIRAQVEKTFAGEKPIKTIQQYFYVWRAAQTKAA
jgi:hypothetical protein